MKLLKKISLWSVCIIAILYIAVCGFFYSKQDEILFLPTKLADNYEFKYPGNYAERKIKTPTGNMLDGLLFKADSSRGLIFYLHGNGGALNTWGDIAGTYTADDYDIFMLDYSGYGKSEGSITSEKQLFDDVQAAYTDLCTLYPENKIIIMGYSIGTCPAAMLAAHNHPKMLILQAPYYSITDMMQRTYPFLPVFLLKYPLKTYEYVKETKVPIIIFHGDSDKVIYYGSSLKLKEDLKPGDQLITLKGQGHTGFTYNPEYVVDLRKILRENSKE